MYALREPAHAVPAPFLCLKIQVSGPAQKALAWLEREKIFMRKDHKGDIILPNNLIYDKRLRPFLKKYDGDFCKFGTDYFRPEVIDPRSEPAMQQNYQFLYVVIMHNNQILKILELYFRVLLTKNDHLWYCLCRKN